MNRQVLAFLILATLGLGAATAATAQIVNGDFSTGIGGWTPLSTGPTVGWHPSAGNPGGTAYFYHNGGGNAELSQTFSCGSAHGNGNCNITLDYHISVNGGAQIQVSVEVDGIAGFTAVHAAEDPAWHTVPLTVPCGDHTLTFKVHTIALPFLARWDVFLDNVAGECVAVVGDDVQDWGALKAQYR